MSPARRSSRNLSPICFIYSSLDSAGYKLFLGGLTGNVSEGTFKSYEGGKFLRFLRRYVRSLAGFVFQIYMRA